MKRIIIITLIFISVSFLYAQKDTTFYKHEIKVSVGDALLPLFWIHSDMYYVNTSFSYYYRPLKWLWVGGNFVNYFGNIMHYHWREYYPNGSFKDFTKSKLKYGAAIAPEIRFSYLNRKSVILYCALSGGICIEDGYSNKKQEYPIFLPYFHLTYLGGNWNFGKNKNIFLGGELGFGFKGLGNIHVGYSF